MSPARRPQPTSRRSIKRWDGRGWSWLLPELRRSMIGLALALVLAVAGGIVARLGGGADGLGNELAVIFLLGYLASYLVLTLAAFLLTERVEVERWAVTSPDSSVWRQLLTGSQPGPSMASGVGLVGLIIGVVWLPAISAGAGWSQARISVVLAVLLLVAAWSAVPVTYAAAYLDDAAQAERHVQHQGAGQ